MPLSSETNKPTYLPRSLAQVRSLLQSLCTATDSATGSQVTLAIKDLPASVADVRDAGWIPGSGRSPEEEMTTHSSILAWRMPWTAEPGGLQSIAFQSWTQLNSLAHTPVGYLTKHICHFLSPVLSPWPKVDQLWRTTQTPSLCVTCLHSSSTKFTFHTAAGITVS